MTTTILDTLRDPNETTELSIRERVFAGASVREPRGLTDAFTLDEIAAIAENPAAGVWRDRAIDILDGVDR